MLLEFLGGHQPGADEEADPLRCLDREARPAAGDDVDGALVGGASLVADDFIGICTYQNA